MAVTKRKGRKAKPWRAEVFVSGVRIASQHFETAGAAHSWHDETKRRYEQGRGVGGEMRFSEVMQRYEDTELAAKVGTTRRRRKGRFKFLADSPIADVRMRDFCGGTVELLLDWLIKHPRAKTSSRKSFLEELKTLSLLMGFYRDTYDAQFVSPVTRRHRKRALFKGPVPKKPKDFYLPVEAARHWLQALRAQRNPVYFELATLQLTLGLRIGEACAICEDAVDLQRGVLVVRRTMEWCTDVESSCRVIAERTKTEESRRELPMPEEVRVAIRTALARQPQVLHRTPEGRLTRVVFHMGDGRLMHDETIRASYTRAFAAVGLPWTGSHICRDTNGTLPLGRVSLEQVRVNHGHTSVVETEGYAKVHAMVRNEVPETVAALLFRGEIGSPAQSHAPIGKLVKLGNDIN